MMYLKIFKKQEETIPKSNRCKEIIKIKAIINELKTKNDKTNQ
jgi:hypothetical protein